MSWKKRALLFWLVICLVLAGVSVLGELVPLYTFYNYNFDLNQSNCEDNKLYQDTSTHGFVEMSPNYLFSTSDLLGNKCCEEVDEGIYNKRASDTVNNFFLCAMYNSKYQWLHGGQRTFEVISIDENDYISNSNQWYKCDDLLLNQNLPTTDLQGGILIGNNSFYASKFLCTKRNDQYKFVECCGGGYTDYRKCESVNNEITMAPGGSTTEVNFNTIPLMSNTLPTPNVFPFDQNDENAIYEINSQSIKNWEGMNTLEIFFMITKNWGWEIEIVGNNDQTLFRDKLAPYVLGEIGFEKELHAVIPITGWRDVEGFRFYFPENTHNYYSNLTINKVFLRPTDSSRLQYCSAANYNPNILNSRWINDLDSTTLGYASPVGGAVPDVAGKEACNNFGYNWTGNKCCGDDAGTETDTYNDTDGGCWRGSFLDENKAVMDVQIRLPYDPQDKLNKRPKIKEINLTINWEDLSKYSVYQTLAGSEYGSGTIVRSMCCDHNPTSFQGIYYHPIEDTVVNAPRCDHISNCYNPRRVSDPRNYRCQYFVWESTLSWASTSRAYVEANVLMWCGKDNQPTSRSVSVTTKADFSEGPIEINLSEIVGPYWNIGSKISIFTDGLNGLDVHFAGKPTDWSIFSTAEPYRLEGPCGGDAPRTCLAQNSPVYQRDCGNNQKIKYCIVPSITTTNKNDKIIIENTDFNQSPETQTYKNYHWSCLENNCYFPTSTDRIWFTFINYISDIQSLFIVDPLGKEWEVRPEWIVNPSSGPYSASFDPAVSTLRAKVPLQVMYYNDTLWGCNLSEHMKREGLVENVSICEVKGKAFCAGEGGWIIDPEATLTSERDTPKPAVPGVNESLSNYLPASCCEATACWNGTICVPDMTGDPQPQYNHSCINGTWKFTPLLNNWDLTETGYCPEEGDCLVDPDYNGFLNYNTTAWYTSLNPNQRPMCLADQQFVKDEFCENITWESRTKKMVIQLLNLVNDTGVVDDYILYCDNYSNVYYGVDLSSILQYIVGPPVGTWGIYPYYQQTNTTATNNFCLLNYQKRGVTTEPRTVVSTSLNIPINDPNSSILYVVATSNDPTSYCNDATGSDVFNKCSNDDAVWYSDDLNSIIFSNGDIDMTGLGFFDTIIDWFKNPIENLINWFLGRATNDQLQKDYNFITNTTRLKYFYSAAKPSGKKVTAVMEELNQTTFILAKYENFTTNMCNYVLAAAQAKGINQSAILQGAFCNQTGTTYDVFVDNNLVPGLWRPLTIEFTFT